MPKWSSFDNSLPNVDRMDESRPGVWHSRRNGKEVASGDSSGGKSKSDADGRSSNAVTGSSVDMSFSPSAKDVDFAHQATGVPSLGQESVNFVRGRP
jgi:hypothetical protein